MSRRPTAGSETSGRVSRRRWLSALGVTGLSALAGCSGEESDEDDAGSGDDVTIGAFPRFGVDDLYGETVARTLARRAFEESDHDYGFDGGDMVTPGGDQVELDIYHSAGQETSQLMAEYIGQELQENRQALQRTLDPETEFDALRSAAWLVEGEFGTKVRVLPAAEAPEDVATKAEPSRPAIDITE